MERYLSLVLDEMGQISLTLEKMEARELDAYIIKNFNSSAEIRQKYSKEINLYLEQHKDFIAKVERDNNKKYAGSIVITELEDNLSIKKKKVLYKKDMIVFKEITKNKKFVSALQNRDYINYHAALKNNTRYDRIFNDYFGIEIRFKCVSDDKFNRIMGSWRNDIKNLNRYYDLIRTVLKEYKNRYKELKLDSPDVVYSKYLINKKETVKAKEVNEEFLSQDEQFIEQPDILNIIEEPPRYVSGADEEDYPGDLEKNDNSQISTMELKYIPEPEIREAEKIERFVSGTDEEGYPGDLERNDNSQISTIELEEGMSFGKTKTLSNGHHKLFDFDN